MTTLRCSTTQTYILQLTETNLSFFSKLLHGVVDSPNSLTDIYFRVSIRSSHSQTLFHIPVHYTNYGKNYPLHGTSHVSCKILISVDQPLYIVRIQRNIYYYNFIILCLSYIFYNNRYRIQVFLYLNTLMFFDLYNFS